MFWALWGRLSESRVRSVAVLICLAAGLAVSATSQTTPTYKLKQGDTIAVGVAAEPLYQGGVAAAVGADGTITLPMIDTIHARGLTVAELKESITKLLSKYIIDPFITVVITQQAPSRVYVLGTGVRAPGTVNIREGDKLSAVLPAVGGVLENADKRGASISRGGQIIPIDLYELLVNKDASQDVVLEDADVIRIDMDLDAKYFVTGYVPKPGVFPFIENVTIMEALTQSGWFLQRAMKKIKIYRRAGSKTQEINVDVDAITQKGNYAQNIALKPLDIVYVAETRKPNWDQLASRLSAFANGFYGLRLLGVIF